MEKENLKSCVNSWGSLNYLFLLKQSTYFRTIQSAQNKNGQPKADRFYFNEKLYSINLPDHSGRDSL